MELSDERKSKSVEALESWVFDQLSAESLPVDALLGAMVDLAARGGRERAEGCAELLQDALTERGERDAGIRLLMRRCEWRENDPAFRDVCRAAARSVLNDRLGAMFVEHVGFDSELPLSECLRRLMLLTKLSPGVLCYDRTWGLGVVQRVDDFYAKVTIDFARKPAHQLAAAYAGETLALVDNSHLLARWHSDPDGLASLIAEDPAEVARIALRSYGPMNVERLREAMQEVGVADDAWKPFWDGARRGLKADPLVDMPARRSDSIRILAEAKEFGDAWVSALEAERDPDRILALCEDLRASGQASDACRAAAADRLAFVLHGLVDTRRAVAARAVLMAVELGITPSAADPTGIGGRLFEPDPFLVVVEELPVRLMRAFLALLWERRAETAADLLLALLPRMSLSVLNEAVTLLIERGHGDRCTDLVRRMLSSGSPGPCLLYWVCRHVDRKEYWESVSMRDLLLQVVDCLGSSYSGEDLRAQHQLRALFGQKAWMSAALELLTPMHREDLLRRVSNLRRWEESNRRSVMARMIRLYPELEKVVAGRSSDDSGTSARRRLTSWRSYRERQETLRDLIEVKIPANSRDIGVARSYGDLRENFEYQAARDQQGLFMQRKGELESDLKDVQGTDFNEFPADVAGMGTCVALRRGEREVEHYSILGEWDGDPALGIVSSQSRLAEALAGRRPGDPVQLPSDAGDDEPGEIVAVTELPEHVKRWMAGEAVASS